MATFLVFVAILAGTVGVMYGMVKVLMLMNKSGKDKAGNVDPAGRVEVEVSRK